ncbi:MAG: YbaB/EbfC family nucleoid-associated protein [Bacteroidota bacterium]
MFGNMMEQLQMMKMKMEEIKNNLETKLITAEAAGGDIQVTINGNKKFKSIQISSALQSGDKEELEEQLCVALNRAIEKAEQVYENEMKAVAGGMLPPGMI